MKTIVFNCDKCGQFFKADHDRPKPFVTDGKTNLLLEVSLKIGAHVKSSYQDSTETNKQICRDCLKNLGLDFSFNTNKERDYPTRQSLEDKLIDILSELRVKFEE